MRKALLDKLPENNICGLINNKTNHNNAVTLFKVAENFNMENDAKTALNCIERCFFSVSKCRSMLELDCALLSKVISSSELNVISELEVFSLVAAWVGHDLGKRKKLARRLLSKVRLPLLSDGALKHLLNDTRWLDDGCLALLSNALNRKGAHPSNRHCSQNSFDVLFLGDESFKLNCATFKTTEMPGWSRTGYSRCEAVSAQGEVYFFGARGYETTCIQKYSVAEESFETVGELPFIDWCVCAFGDGIYVIGGCHAIEYGFCCARFNCKDRSLEPATDLNVARSWAACAAFQGKVVVSGGFAGNRTIRQVEALDCAAGRWSSMPSLVYPISHHSMVAASGSKLFVVALQPWLWEMYDAVCGKFVAFKVQISRQQLTEKAVEVGGKLVLFCKDRSVLTLDLETSEISHLPVDLFESVKYYGCVKIPHGKFHA